MSMIQRISEWSLNSSTPLEYFSQRLICTTRFAQAQNLARKQRQRLTLHQMHKIKADMQVPCAFFSPNK